MPATVRRGPAALLAALVVLAPGGLAAQTPIHVRSVHPEGELRLRGEWDGRTAATGDDQAVLSRIRLGALADLEPWLRVVVQLQDARAWGTEANTLTDASADQFDLHQGYVELGRPGRLVARLGRQEVALADERLVGPVGWTNTGRAFDGAVVTVPAGRATLTALWLTVAERDALLPTGLDPQRNEGTAADGWLSGLAATVPGAWGTLEATLLHDRRAATDESWTGHLRMHGTHERLRWEAAGAYQFGSRRRAYLLSGRLGTAVGRGSVAAQVDLLSGDGDPGDRTRRAFHSLYMTGHKFYGFMDYVVALPSATADAGLLDAMLRAAVPAGRWDLRADLHHLRTAARRAGRRALGTELDLTAGRALAPGTRLELGVSAFVPADLATSVFPAFGAGDGTTYWGYTMLTVRFP